MKVAVTALWLAFAGAGAEDGKPHLSDFQLILEDHQVLVSFELVNGFSERHRERIEAGLPTSLIYRFKLERPRFWWFDGNVKRSNLEVVAIYNAVTLEYRIDYKQDGRLIDSRIVKELPELERAMTTLHAFPVFALEDVAAGRRVVVRARASLGSKTILGFIPTAIETDAVESGRFSIPEPQP